MLQYSRVRHASSRSIAQCGMHARSDSMCTRVITIDYHLTWQKRTYREALENLLLLGSGGGGGGGAAGEGEGGNNGELHVGGFGGVRV